MVRPGGAIFDKKEPILFIFLPRSIIKELYCFDICMLTEKEFLSLSTNAQKEYLHQTVAQIPSDLAERENIVLLLESDASFTSETLLSIYNTIAAIISDGKTETVQAVASRVQNIHAMMQEESLSSQAEADDILSDM